MEARCPMGSSTLWKGVRLGYPLICMPSASSVSFHLSLEGSGVRQGAALCSRLAPVVMTLPA
jgi:hypothetical protein